jgi:hypothetical protein
LSDHGIALNVNTQLLGRKARPDASGASIGSIRSILWIEHSNFNISVVNAVFLRWGTVDRFEAKPHVS